MPERGLQPEQELLQTIEQRRRSVNAYLRRARPRYERLTYLTIISSALAAALTAGPALGGKDFADGVSGILGLEGGASVWRPLCFLAMIVSVIAAISANLSKFKNSEVRIVGAETCNCELEGLQTMLKFRQLSLEEAIRMYQESVAKIPFVPDDSLLASKGSNDSGKSKEWTWG